MHFKNFDLVGVIFVVVINVIWTQVPNRPLIIGIILTVPLMLFLPGYALTQALFRRQEPSHASTNLVLQPILYLDLPFSTAGQIMLSLGLSMAIDILTGFILNILPIGLQTLSWILSLGLITTVFTILAMYFRRRNRIKLERMQKPRITVHDGILFGLAILVATAGIWLSIIRPPVVQAAFTQFWILPATQTMHGCTVRVGVQSFESTSVTYRIIVTENNVQVNVWQAVVLAPQKEWDQLVSSSPTSTKSVYIEAKLYKINKPETVYREVHMTLSSTNRSKDQKVRC